MIKILQGDWIERLRELPDRSVHCVVTSPPYWGLRDYGVPGQLGLEATPEEYVSKLVQGFREVRRVLRDDGTLWLNLGDCYASNAATNKGHPGGFESYRGSDTPTLNTDQQGRNAFRSKEIKGKDLVGIPWLVGFALRADGWWLRQDIIWSKPNPMPESVTDRCTKSHEYIFLLSKSARYFYDAEAIKEPAQNWGERDRKNWRGKVNSPDNPQNGCTNGDFSESGRNKRTVWTVATAPYSEAHFATFPPDLIKPCILAGTSARGCCSKCGASWERVVEKSANPLGLKNGEHREVNRNGGLTERTNDPLISRTGKTGDYKTLGWTPTCQCGAATIPCTVLDPFGGSGTTGQVALELGRSAILIELNPEYIELAQERTFVTPGLPL